MLRHNLRTTEIAIGCQCVPNGFFGFTITCTLEVLGLCLQLHEVLGSCWGPIELISQNGDEFSGVAAGVSWALTSTDKKKWNDWNGEGKMVRVKSVRSFRIWDSGSCWKHNKIKLELFYYWPFTGNNNIISPSNVLQQVSRYGAGTWSNVHHHSSHLFRENLRPLNILYFVCFFQSIVLQCSLFINTISCLRLGR